MTSLVSAIAGRLVSTGVQTTGAGSGIVISADQNGKAVIASDSRKLIIQLTSGTLRQGETVAFKTQGDQVIVVPLSSPSSNISSAADAFESDLPADDALQALARLLGNGGPGPLTQEERSRVAGTVNALARHISLLDGQSQAAARQLIDYALTGLGGEAADLDRSRLTQLLQDLVSKMSISVSSVSFQVKAELPPAFLFFPSESEARAWTSANGVAVSPAQRNRLETFIADAPVAFRVLSRQDGQNSCMGMSPHGAGGELLHYIRAHLTDSFWATLSTETLTALLRQRGSIALGRLSEIDRVLSAKQVDGPAGVIAFGSDGGLSRSPAASEAGILSMRVQWLSVACDPTVKLSAIPQPPQPAMAAAIGVWIEKTRPAPTSKFSAETPPNDNLYVKQGNLGSGEQSHAAITRVMSALGFDFEHGLAFGNSPTDETEGRQRSLKAIVLSLLESAQKDTTEALGTTPEADRVAGLRKVLNEFRGIAEAFKDAYRDSPASIEALRQELKTAVRLCAAEITVRFDGTIQPALTRIVSELETALEDVLSRLRAEVSALGVKGNDRRTDNRGLAGVNDAFSKAADVARKASESAAREVGAAFERMEQAVTDANVKPAVPPAPTQQPQTASTQQLQAVLSRIDSIQILAKPVETPQGQQRVIVLPMKIDGQWNDVVMKFVSGKRGSGGKRKTPMVSVALHVAPALLGEIDVTMEYVIGGSVSIRMMFEKEPVRVWFDTNKTAIAAAIQSQGIASVRLTTHRQPVIGQPGSAGKRRTESGAIDIVA